MVLNKHLVCFVNDPGNGEQWLLQDAGLCCAGLMCFVPFGQWEAGTGGGTRMDVSAHRQEMASDILLLKMLQRGTGAVY